MLDKKTPRAPTVQVVESPPRQRARPADPCAIVIFGAGGDLTKRLVIPALYNIARTKVLPEKFALIGVDLAEGISESWRDNLHDMLKSFVGNAAAEFDVDEIDETAWQRLAEKMSYVQGDLTKSETYQKISASLAEAEKTPGTQGNVIFYLAVADRFFGTVVEHAWRVVQPVLDDWAKHGAANLQIYPAGSSGRNEADALLARDGRCWRSVGGGDDGQPS